MSRSRVRCAPRRQGARLYDQARPAAPLSRRYGRTQRPSRTVPIGFGPIRPACSTVRPWPPSTAVRPPRAGRSGGRRGAMGADRARGEPREGRPPKARPRRPLDGPGAHRVGDLGSFSLRGRTDRGRQVVADAAHCHAPGGSRRWTTSAWPDRAGAVPFRHPPRRGASPPGPWGPPVRRGPPADQRSLAAPASPCWDAPEEPARPSHNPR